MPTEPNPLVAFGDEEGLSRREVWEFFDVPESTFKQLVTGHTRASWDRAREWEKRSGGRVRAVDVMAWQEKHAPRSAA